MLKKHKLATLALGAFLSVFQLWGQVQLTNIPSIHINTIGGAAVNSKTVWIPGFLTVVGGDTSDVILNDTIEIRGRGNSTWDMPKKPYRIKFRHKRHLLNMKDDAKDWVLLANYVDKTLIRNAVSFEIGQFLDMEFTPSVKFADVYLNNNYIGNYMVTDQIEAGINRVNIEKLDTTDVVEPNVSGGYLFERDGFYNRELVWYKTPKDVFFTIHEPDPSAVKPSQLTYLTNFTTNFETKLFGANWKDSTQGYRAILDTTSFLRWYIASELTGNIDCFWSTNMYKRRNDPKLYYGPLWDYDIAYNNDKRRNDIAQVRMNDLTSARGAFGNRTWINQISTDPWFKVAVNNLWKEVVAKDVKARLQFYVDSLVTVLDASIKKNYERWPTLNTLIYNEWYKYPTYQEYVNVLKTYINTRVDFLTTSFAADAASIPVVTPPTSPFKLENYYYSVTNKTSMTLMDVQNQSNVDSARAVLYTSTTGRNSQQWKLMPQSDGSFVFVNRYTNKAMRSNGLNRTARLFVTNTADTRQRWKIVPMNMGNGTYKLVNVSTSNVLENTNGSSALNTLVNENPAAAVENTNQAWLLDKVAALPVGLDAVEQDFNLRYGPNPVSDILYVQMDGLDAEARLELYDLRGSRLLHQQMNTQEAELNVQSINDGLYLLKITAGQQCKTVKVVVKH